MNGKNCDKSNWIKNRTHWYKDILKSCINIGDFYQNEAI